MRQALVIGRADGLCQAGPVEQSVLKEDSTWVGGEDDVNAIASAFWTQAAAEDLGIWVERVESESNPADLPPRGL